ncbi:MAG TPA: ribosomal protein S18-alanine N-acetyltransferase [Terriglobales bacterium]|nr:ribosomal protein S18-alanine N-acetyltransferase [Terriglobales bacterium]
MFIRAATVADIPTMRELDLASAYGARWSEGHYYGLFSSATPQRHLVLIAESQDSIVGYLAASGVGDEWEVENVIVATLMLRHGIAKALLEELLERLRRAAARRLHLEVRESNQPARALYAQFGFAEAHRRPAYYSDPVEDAIVLSRAP